MLSEHSTCLGADEGKFAIPQSYSWALSGVFLPKNNVAQLACRPRDCHLWQALSSSYSCPRLALDRNDYQIPLYIQNVQIARERMTSLLILDSSGMNWWVAFLLTICSVTADLGLGTSLPISPTQERVCSACGPMACSLFNRNDGMPGASSHALSAVQLQQVL